MSSVFEADYTQSLCWSNAGASAQNASERFTKHVIEDGVDEGVGSEREQSNPRRDQLHQVGELQSCQAKQASDVVRKEKTDEAGQDDHGGACNSPV